MKPHAPSSRIVRAGKKNHRQMVPIHIIAGQANDQTFFSKNPIEFQKKVKRVAHDMPRGHFNVWFFKAPLPFQIEFSRQTRRPTQLVMEVGKVFLGPALQTSVHLAKFFLIVAYNLIYATTTKRKLIHSNLLQYVNEKNQNPMDALRFCKPKSYMIVYKLVSPSIILEHRKFEAKFRLV